MCGIIYFIYHALAGNRGIFALIDITYKIEESYNKLDAIRAERINLEHRVSLMSDKSMDLDLLDEQSRKVLGYAKEDEVILFLE